VSEALRPGSVASVKPDSIGALSTLTPLLIKSTAVAALAGLFGFDTAVIAGTTQALVHVFNLTPASLGLTVAIALRGTFIGAMVAGIPGDRMADATACAALRFFLRVRARICDGLELACLRFFLSAYSAQFHLDSSPS